MFYIILELEIYYHDQNRLHTLSLQRFIASIWSILVTNILLFHYSMTDINLPLEGMQLYRNSIFNF